MSLDICGAFGSVLCDGLLQHLWSVGLKGNLCDKSLFFVARGDTSCQKPFTAKFLKVEFGLLLCLSCIFIIFQLRFCTALASVCSLALCVT